MILKRDDIRNMTDTINCWLYDLEETSIISDDQELLRVTEYLRVKLSSAFQISNNFIVRCK